MRVQDAEALVQVTHCFCLLQQELWERLHHARLFVDSSVIKDLIRIRYCYKNYCLNREGDGLFINVVGMHHDADIYPDPETFNPENFSKEAKAGRSPYAFLPFGHGPRACVGMRFALLEAKAGLAAVLRHFELARSPRTPDTVTVDPGHMLSGSKHGLWVRAVPRRL